jgi:uncharacterized protein with FMN-binding domain
LTDIETFINHLKNMKKIWGWIVGVVLVIAVGAYIIWNSSSAAPMVATTGTPGSGAPDTTGTQTPSSTPAGSSPGNGGSVAIGTGTTTVTTGGSGYKDGTYTGTVADAIYGQLQVAVTISGGKITDVAFPVYPNGPGHTSQVSASALPALKQEAIASQSANVSVVSGATQDSAAFQESLASALTQAKS